LLVLVAAQCLDREGWQAQHGLAGGGLEGVDAGQGLAEPDGASVQVEVVPFQAAQFAIAGTGCRGQDHESAQPWLRVVVGGGQQHADLLRGEGRPRVGGDGGWFGVGGGLTGRSCHFMA
jgi:hypothetical protein